MEKTSRGQNVFTSLSPSAYLYAVILAIFIWSIETFLEKYIFGFEGTFLEQLFYPGIHELWMRSIVVALTIVIIVLAFLLIRHRHMENSLYQSEKNYLRNYILQSTISAVLEQSMEPISLKSQMEHILDIVLTNPLFGEEGKGSIFIFDEQSSLLKLEAQKGMPEGTETRCSSVELGQCLCGRAASSQEIIFSDHIDYRHEIHYHDMRPHGQYCIPILSGKKLLGVLTFYIKTGHKRKIEEESFLLSIAHAIAGVIERKKAEVELNERMKLAEMSADTGIAFTTAVTLQDALQKCSESLVYHLDALFARIWIFDKKERVLKLKSSAGLYTHLDGPHSIIPFGKYKIGKIAENQTPHITNQVAGDPFVNDQEWVKKEKIVSFAGHPLLLKDRLIGVMAIFSRNTLPEITVKALSSVADQISIGIDQKIKEEQVLQAKEKWETTFDTIPDIVIVIDRNHRIVRANSALSKRLGFDRENIVGKPCYTVVHGTSDPPSYCPHLEVLSDGREQVVEIFDKNLNGHFQFSVTPIFNAMGIVIATVHVARDITRRKRIEEQLQEAAITDELTGLRNRRGFFALAEQQCRLSDRTKRGITLLYLDIDGMKTINDELGHSAGDQALKDVAALLKNSFRGSDILARMGGDEFAVLLTEPSEKTEPAVISHLMKNVSNHNENTGRNYELMISIGISHYDPSNPCSIEEMLMKADSLMYKDKISHKDPDNHFVRNNPEKEQV